MQRAHRAADVKECLAVAVDSFKATLDISDAAFHRNHCVLGLRADLKDQLGDVSG